MPRSIIDSCIANESIPMACRAMFCFSDVHLVYSRTDKRKQRYLPGLCPKQGTQMYLDIKH